MIEVLAARAPVRTPAPVPSWHPSSNFSTPVTLRRIYKVAKKLDDVLQEDEGLDEEFSYD